MAALLPRGSPHQKRRGCMALLAALAVIILVTVLLIVWRAAAPQQASMHAARISNTANPMPAAVLDGGVAIDAAQRKALGELLLAHDDFASAFRFLLAASLRDRCQPAHAHELARMAVAAGVPVLGDTKAALLGHASLRQPAYQLVSRLAATAPCAEVALVVIGGFSMTLDLEHYAAMFPDSYFSPDLMTAPADILNRSLSERVADPCTPILYAAVPLNTERSWQCIGLRATLRRRLQTMCSTSMHEHSGDDDKMAEQMIASIRGELDHMSLVCR